MKDIKAQLLLTIDSCCFTYFLSIVMCYQTQDLNNNYCKYNYIILFIIFYAFNLQSNLNICKALSSFNTKNFN